MKKKIAILATAFLLMLPIIPAKAAESDVETVAESKYAISDEAEMVEEEVKEIEINEVNFPDSEFRRYLKDNHDEDGNGYIDPTKIGVQCDYDKYMILDYTGIEKFTNMVGITFYNFTDKIVIKKCNLSDKVELFTIFKGYKWKAGFVKF